MDKKEYFNKELILKYFNGWDDYLFAPEGDDLNFYKENFKPLFEQTPELEREAFFRVVHKQSLSVKISMGFSKVLVPLAKSAKNEMKELYQFFNEYDLFSPPVYEDAKDKLMLAIDDMDLHSITFKTNRADGNVVIGSAFAKVEIVSAVFKMLYDRKDSLSMPMEKGKKRAGYQIELAFFMRQLTKMVKNENCFTFKSARQLNIMLGQWLARLQLLQNEDEFLFDENREDSSYNGDYQTYLSDNVKAMKKWV